MAARLRKFDIAKTQRPFSCAIITTLFQRHPDVTRLFDFKWIEGYPKEFHVRDGDHHLAFAENLSVIELVDGERTQTAFSKEMHEHTAYSGARVYMETETFQLTEAKHDQELRMNRVRVCQTLNVIAPRWPQLKKHFDDRFGKNCEIRFYFGVDSPEVTLIVNKLSYFTIALGRHISVTGMDNDRSLAHLENVLSTSI